MGAKIGGGGNGDVYRCSDAGSSAAIKVFRHRNASADRMERFRREIGFLLAAQEFPGILPLIDHSLPGNGGGTAWYVMPLAEPLSEALGSEPTLDLVVTAVVAYASTLRDLAKSDVHHRDIKPDNLFRLNGQWVIGDFGLVKYPDASPLTREGRKVGPTDYIAPEMRHNADTADAELADVYSLAKTLWVLATGSNLPLPGQQRVEDDSSRLTARSAHPWAPYLDRLIERCTDNNPAARPRMDYVSAELNALANPAERPPSSTPDLAEEADKILTLGQPHTRKREEIDQTRFAGAKAAVRIHESAKSVFDEALSKLPHFYINDPVQVSPPRSWVADGATNIFHSSWGAALIAPPGIGVSVTVGYVLKVLNTAGSSRLFICVTANRKNGGRGDQREIIASSFDVDVPSAQFDVLASEVESLYRECLPDIFKAIREMMESELALQRSLLLGEVDSGGNPDGATA
ncbi:serine/threonine protein kinase [Actinoplanes xinjiangensis]|uniref:Serine/threonine protein kinase n=1 Tax=Actinoplanes xinjiangensis TaxID=512350 RepID=A0A316F7K8_9ACTN|nr:serine/threonine protein kinase [Actinoplanes xinjiangensis]